MYVQVFNLALKLHETLVSLISLGKVIQACAA